MKRIHFVKLLFVAVLATGSLNTWGAEVTFTPSDYAGSGGASGSGGSATATKDGVTIASTKAYVDGTTAVREYSSGTLTISSSNTISKIVITATGSSYAMWTTTNGSISTSSAIQTWTGSSTSIELKASAQCRWKSIVVTYESSGSGETTYSVTFNAGTNGTCSTESLTEASTGSGVTLPNCTPNTGYTFVGWATTSSATKADAGAAGVNYKPNSHCTLYAVYSANQITWTITFEDKMHGTTIPSQTVSNGGTFTFPSVEDKTKEAGTCAGEHYHFVG